MLVWSILHIHYWLFVAATLTPFLNAKKSNKKKRQKVLLFPLRQPRLTDNQPSVCFHTMLSLASFFISLLESNTCWEELDSFPSGTSRHTL